MGGKALESKTSLEHCRTFSCGVSSEEPLGLVSYTTSQSAPASEPAAASQKVQSGHENSAET